MKWGRILVAGMLWPMALQADINSKTDQWFNTWNNANVTQPQVVRNQGGGYYFTGGGVSARNRITRVGELVSFQPPSMSAGCSGIDIYSGGFGFIDADAFIDSLKGIADNAESLVYMLAIQAVSPQLNEAIETIQSWAEKANRLAMDSCAAATELVGGVGEAMGRENFSCEVRRQNNYGESWEEAKAKCQNQGARSTRNADRVVAERNDVTFSEGNLTWMAVKGANASGILGDRQANELYMTLFGTLIRSFPRGRADETAQDLVLPSAFTGIGATAEWDNVINALIKGGDFGDLRIYKCRETENCLAVSTSPEAVTINKGMEDRVLDLIDGIVDALANDTPLSNEEVKLISSSPLPIFAYIRTVLALAGGNPAMLNREQWSEYARVLAELIVIQNLMTVAETVRLQAHNMPQGISTSEGAVQSWVSSIDFASALLLERQKQVEGAWETKLAMIDQIAKYERKLVATLGREIVLNSWWERNK